MNLNLMFAALSAVFVLNVSLFAQQTPLPQLGITPTQASQHSILERPGQPKLPIAHVAQGPVDKSANETFKDEPSILNIEKAAQETDLLMIDTSVDYDTSDSARNDAQPKLQQTKKFAVSFEGPSEIQQDKLQIFQFRVTNAQNVPSRPAVIRLNTADGLEFVDSTVQARVDPERKMVEWPVRSLAPNESLQVNFRSRGTQPGEKTQSLSVLQDLQLIQNQTFQSYILEKQAIQASIVSRTRSVPVGHPKEVEVRLTNLTPDLQQNLEVQIELPEGVQVVDSVLYNVEGNLVKFLPFDIRANQTRHVSLTVVGNTAGQSQLSATVVSKTHPISNKENTELRFFQVARAGSELTSQR